MAFDQLLADRVRQILLNESASQIDYPQGVGFVINGNLACGVYEDYLIVQVGVDRFEEILTHPLSRPLDMEGKPTPGWIGIIPTGTKRDNDLAGWIHAGLEFARGLTAD